MKLFASLTVLTSVLVQIILFTAPDYFFTQGALLTFYLTLLSLGLFILTDIVNERFGPRVAAAIVTLGFFAQGLTIMIAFAMGQPYPPMTTVFLLLFGAWCGDILDTIVYAYLKRQTKEKLLWLRVLLSTSCALAVNLLFFVVVLGVSPSALFATQLAWNFVAIVASIPLVYMLHHRLFRTVI